MCFILLVRWKEKKKTLLYSIVRADEEQVSKTALQKQLRELTTQLQELQEDLDLEKEARLKAEKHKKDLAEVRNLTALANKTAREKKDL